MFRNNLYILLAVVGLLVLISKKLILFAYGIEYIDVIIPLQILAPGVAMMGTTRLLIVYISGKGHPEITSYVVGVSLLINIALNLLWLPRFGVQGAAYAALISYVFVSVVLTIIFIRMSDTTLKQLLILNKTDIMRYKTVGRQFYKKII